MQAIDQDTGTIAVVERAVYRRLALAQFEAALETALDDMETARQVAPDPRQFAQAVGDVVLTSATDHPLVAHLAPFWSSAKVREELGIRTRQALASRIASGSVLALRTADGRLLFPVFQFFRTANGVRVRDGLSVLFSELREFDPWSVALIAVTPAPELVGQCPCNGCATATPPTPSQASPRPCGASGQCDRSITPCVGRAAGRPCRFPGPPDHRTVVS